MSKNCFIPLRDACAVFCCNKQDLPNAMDENEISEGLELYKIRNRNWMIFPMCALTGEGCWEMLDWLAKELVSA